MTYGMRYKMRHGIRSWRGSEQIIMQVHAILIDIYMYDGLNIITNTVKKLS